MSKKKAKKVEAPPPSKERVTVFVYGTLKRGFPLHEWMTGSKFLGVEAITGYTLLNFGAYPALYKIGGVPGPAEFFSVSGEVWSMPENYFESLRAMEERVGYSTILVKTTSNINALAFVYDAIPEGTVEWTPDGQVALIPEVKDDLPF